MHATKAYGRVEVYISLGTRSTSVVSFTPQLLTRPRDKIGSGTFLIISLVGTYEDNIA